MEILVVVVVFLSSFRNDAANTQTSSNLKRHIFFLSFDHFFSLAVGVEVVVVPVVVGVVAVVVIVVPLDCFVELVDGIDEVEETPLVPPDVAAATAATAAALFFSSACC